MSRKVAVFVVAAAGATFVAAPATGVIGGNLAAQQDPALQGPLVTAAQIPTADGDEKARATGILTNDARFQALVGSTPYRVTSTGAWTTFKEVQIGATIEITFDRPAHLSGKWPTVVYDETEQTDPPYAERDATLDASDVSGLSAQVDLRRGKLVGIMPLPGATVVAGPDEPKPLATSSGR